MLGSIVTLKFNQLIALGSVILKPVSLSIEVLHITTLPLEIKGEGTLGFYMNSMFPILFVFY